MAEAGTFQGRFLVGRELHFALRGWCVCRGNRPPVRRHSPWQHCQVLLASFLIQLVCLRDQLEMVQVGAAQDEVVILTNQGGTERWPGGERMSGSFILLGLWHTIILLLEKALDFLTSRIFEAQSLGPVGLMSWKGWTSPDQ